MDGRPDEKILCQDNAVKEDKMISGAPEKLNSPAEVGKALQALRENSGCSLDHISSETKIAVDVLKDLEDGCWERLGSKFLVKSFVRMYCKTLGVSPDPFVEAIERLGETYRKRYNFERLLQQKPRRIRNKSRLIFYAVIIVISSFMVTGGVYLFHLSNRHPTPRPEAVRNSAPPPPDLTYEQNAKKPIGLVDRKYSPPESLQGLGATLQDKTMPGGGEGTAATSGQEKAGSAETAEDTSLKLRALGEAWVRVWVNDAKPVSKLMTPGEEMVFSNTTKAKLILGNAGGTEIIWHGKKLPLLGKRGQVVRLTLPDDISRIKSEP